jgi:acyl-CoA synthetase (AMP-forming)/AMP-acid ligase II
MDVRKAVFEAARTYKDKTAFIFEGKETDFVTLRNNSFKLARALADLGIKNGERVAIYLPNCPEYVYSYLALYAAGVIVVPLDFFLQEDEIVNMLSHCEAGAIITTTRARFDLGNLRKRIPSLKEIITVEDDPGYKSFWSLICCSQGNLVPQGFNEDNISSIFYTSGSTGRPKGVVWNFRHLDLGIDCMRHFLNLNQEDRSISAVSFSHVAGVLFPMGAIRCGVSFVIMPHFSPLEFVRLIQEYKVTVFWIVPPMFLAVLNLKELDDYDLCSLRWADVFGAPSNPEIIRKFKKYCPNGYLINGWGMTETAPPTVVSGPDDVKPVGKVTPWAEIRIFDPQDREVSLGGVGEVLIRGEVVFSGYYKEPELTRELMRNGWFHTGDLGRFDEKGNLYIVGRTKDVLKVSGEIVYTPEVEAVLLSHPCVSEVAIIGVEDKLRGEVPKAFVVLKEGISISGKHLRHFCREHLANFKVPHYVEFRDSLPKTGPHKIDKVSLAK